MRIEIPELSVVVLVGASGSGKTTFARRFFKETEILSSDFFRALVSDDENDQSATAAAFDCLYHVAGKRLDAGKLTVIDATNVKKPDREKNLELARGQNCHAVAIVLNLPEKVCQERNSLRPNRDYPRYVVRNHVKALKHDLRSLRREGFLRVYTLESLEDVENAELIRTPLWNDKREEAGPFDIVGDVHGCYDELCCLLERLGYSVDKENGAAAFPNGERKAVFLGDLCDRGPENVKTLRLVMNMTESGAALCVPGNHDTKLLRWLKGAQVQFTHGLDVTVKEMEEQPPEFREKARSFLSGLVSHYLLDGGKLVVAHAGLKEKFQGRASGTVRKFCLYGETTGETDEFGLPVRLDWAEEYRGKAFVVYGHTPSEEAQILNNTFCVDTGCVFGGALTALRYPEKELARVPARREYYAPAKPLRKEGRDRGERGERLDARDVLGKRHIVTRLYGGITVEEAHSAAALEIMSRFAADPRWLVYLPPTMSPCETSRLEGYLEHPLEALGYYKNKGVERAVCERKHMGSRAVIVLCRNEETAKTRFGIEKNFIEDSTAFVPGLIYTRTGRHFFSGAEADKEGAVLSRLRAVLDETGFWKDFETDWVCLDAELMPWSAKAQKLLTDQYASVGRAGRSGLAEAIVALERGVARRTGVVAADKDAPGRDADLAQVLENYKGRLENLESYTEAWRRYCWPTPGVGDYRIAPFHILATEGRVWNDANHLSHMETVAKYMTGHDPLFAATEHIAVDLRDEGSIGAAADWWLRLTASGSEGMVVKPLDFVVHKKNGKNSGNELLQPAVKCRGREYLRIIYGPEYTDALRLERLKKRSLAGKRRLALAEFALGMESLERFVNREPLYRVHECVFAVLAMESEPVDPRL
jgi:protein phosphatase